VLQFVAVCYSVLLCVVVCCFVLQREGWSVLEWVEEGCSVMECFAVYWGVLTVRCSALQCVAVCCSELQYIAVRCSVLQCVAVYWGVLKVCCSVL